MENRNTTLIAAVLTVAIIMLLFSFTYTLKTTDGSTVIDEALTVSMPRPVTEMLLGFSLEGRSIIREIEAAVVGIPAIAKKADKKPTANATKAIADKGKKPTMTPAQAAAARLRTQLNEQRRKAFQARVIEQADRYRESLRLKAEERAYTDLENELGWLADQKTKTANNGNPDKDEEANPDKLTAAEWKSLILAQPTEANVQKMIKAVNTGGIEVDTYLEISEALIKDNSQDKRRMGVWALTSIYRHEAFTSAAHLAAETDATTKKLLIDYMYNYNRAQTLGIFDHVLKASDTVAAAAAAEAISKAIQNIQSASNQNGSQRNGSRNSSGSVQQLTMSSYKRLIPTLQFVVAKNLNNLSQWAQTLISQLQTIATTA